MALVDWSNREFEIAPGVIERISEEEVRHALRVDDAKEPFSRKEAFIRDRFDDLLDALQRLEHYIGVNELRGFRHEISRYMHVYNFENAQALLNRYSAWTVPTSARTACVAKDEPTFVFPGLGRNRDAA